jgi:hypothetical protein
MLFLWCMLRDLLHCDVVLDVYFVKNIKKIIKKFTMALARIIETHYLCTRSFKVHLG